jgi:hypothetical protein
MMSVPGIELGLPTMSVLKYQKKICMGFELLPPALELRTMPLDHQRWIIIISTKLYFAKSQGKGTNLGSSEWN